MTTDTPMVERCARAIEAAPSYAVDHPGPPCGSFDWFVRQNGSGKIVESDLSEAAARRLAHKMTREAKVRAVLECLRTPTPEMVEAIMQEQVCGYTIEGKHVPCNHQSTAGLLDPYGKPLGREKCECISSFTAAIDRALQTPPLPSKENQE